jgi:hypothetical protein
MILTWESGAGSNSCDSQLPSGELKVFMSPDLNVQYDWV